MFTPSTFERVRIDDYTVSPFTVHKDFTVFKSEMSSSGYTVRQGYYYRNAFPVGYKTVSVQTAPTSSDGTYNYLNWRSLYNLYYSNPYDSVEGLEGYNQNMSSKQLFLTASIISAPFFDIGEGIKPGSVTLSSNNFYLKDDKNNNLYDVRLTSRSYVDSTHLDAYWGFQNLYTKTSEGYGLVNSHSFTYISNTQGEDLNTTAHNIHLSHGVSVNGSPTGAGIDFKHSQSYLFTRHVRQFNYETEDNFCISFWIRTPVSQSDVVSTTNTVLSKNSYADFNIRVSNPTAKFEEGSQITTSRISTEYRPIDIYPYRFEVYNQTAGINSGKIKFTRSDGFQTVILKSSSTINDGQYHHICVNKSSSILSLYIDGVLSESSYDVPDQPTNDYHLLFGSENFSGLKQFSGSIDEVRFYNTYATPTQISQSLAEKTLGYLYQTPNVGNVYYKRGEVVITSPIRSYHNTFNSDNWKLSYKNNYTIYEFETLVRIKAGTYNKTMNPSSVKSPKSNEYIDEFVTGSLLPYVTTIGLYNDKLQLVAVGKLARPLKMRPDVDINVIVRWDY